MNLPIPHDGKCKSTNVSSHLFENKIIFVLAVVGDQSYLIKAATDFVFASVIQSYGYIIGIMPTIF